MIDDIIINKSEIIKRCIARIKIENNLEDSFDLVKKILKLN